MRMIDAYLFTLVFASLSAQAMCQAPQQGKKLSEAQARAQRDELRRQHTNRAQPRLPDYSGSHVFGLLDYTVVRKEISLTDECYSKIRKISEDGAAKDREIRAKLRELPGGRILEPDAIRTVQAQTVQQMFALLSEPQVLRLRQIPYHMEIAFYGFGRALSEGQLGKEIGVHQNQLTHLISAWTKEEANYNQQVKTFERTAHEKVMALLPEKQRTTANQLLGPYFDFYETICIEGRDMLDNFEAAGTEEAKKSLRHFSEIDYTRLENSAWSLTDPALLAELHLNDEQRGALKDYLRDVGKGESDSDTLISRASEFLDEILPPDQANRLRQLGYFIEIGNNGYGRALTTGILAKKIGIRPDQHEAIRNGVALIERELSEDRRNAYGKALNNYLNELSAEQRAKARECLGEPFQCPPSMFAHEKSILREQESQIERRTVK